MAIDKRHSPSFYSLRPAIPTSYSRVTPLLDLTTGIRASQGPTFRIRVLGFVSPQHLRTRLEVVGKVSKVHMCKVDT
jgi:hypothetical protein